MEDGEDRIPRKLQAALVRSFIVGSPTEPSRTISTYFEAWVFSQPSYGFLFCGRSFCILWSTCSSNHSYKTVDMTCFLALNRI